MTQKTKVIAIATVALSLFSFTIGGKYFEISKNLDLFISLYAELNTYYVDDLDTEALMEEGINAMLQSLDPYTVYYPEEEMEGYNLQMTGKYGGIGSLINKSEEYVIISEPYEGFPAQKAGLIAGDRIIEINGESFVGKESDDVSKVLRGAPGTAVTLTIEKPRTGERSTIKLIREEVEIKSVPFAGMVDNNVGYIRLTTFTNDCSKDVKEALANLSKENDLKGVILDLRGNPGGLLQEAVNISNLFIDRGIEVVKTKGRIREWEKTFKTRFSPVDTEIPIVVLTSRGSASASEIVSGVLQDYDRGVIIGERTFGKGLVQSTKDVGYNAKLKLTTAKYYLPCGRCVQAIDYSGKYKDGSDKINDSLRTAYKTINNRVVYDAGGVDPDIKVEAEELSQITISLIRKQLIFDFSSDFVEKNKTIPSARDFKITDALFDEFVGFIADKEYDYETQSEDFLKELKKNAEEENYYESIEQEITQLETKIKHDKEKDLFKYKGQIKEYLESEIVTRYYHQKGRIEATLDDDPFVMEAAKVLNNPAQYNKILAKN